MACNVTSAEVRTAGLGLELDSGFDSKRTTWPCNFRIPHRPRKDRPTGLVAHRPDMGFGRLVADRTAFDVDRSRRLPLRCRSWVGC